MKTKRRIGRYLTARQIMNAGACDAGPLALRGKRPRRVLITPRAMAHYDNYRHRAGWLARNLLSWEGLEAWRASVSPDRGAAAYCCKECDDNFRCDNERALIEWAKLYVAEGAKR